MADQPFKIVGIAGSLRRASWNRGLLRAAVEGRPDGIEIVTLDLDLVPPYNQDVEDAGEPVPVVAFKEAILRADALLVATPEYNHGVPVAACRSHQTQKLTVTPAQATAINHHPTRAAPVTTGSLRQRPPRPWSRPSSSTSCA